MARTTMLVLLLLPLVTALFEDQIGLFDWHKRFVGQVEFAVVDTSAIIVSTKSGAFAALDHKTGALMWRHVFTKNDSITNTPLLYQDRIHTRHASGQCRMWNIQTGILMGESQQFKGNFHMVIAGDMKFRVQPSKMQAVMYGKAATAGFHSGTNKDEAMENLLQAGLIKQDYDIEAIMIAPGAKGRIVGFNTKTEKLSSNNNIDNSWATPYLNYVTSGDSMAVMNGDTIYYKVFGVNAFRSVVTSELGLPWAVTSLEGVGKSVYIAHGDNKAVILRVLDGQMKAVKALTEKVVGVLSAVDQITLLSQQEDTINVQLVSLLNGVELTSYSISGAGRGGVMMVEVLPVSHSCTQVREGNVRLRGLLVQWQDHTMSVEGPEADCGWVREESLASILSAYLVDLPASSIIPADLSKSVNPIKMWTDRLALQIADLEKMIQLHFGNGRRDLETDMEQDAFNLHKLVVVATSVGKLHALHSGTGRIVWSKYLQDIKPVGDNKQFYPLHLLRSSSHYPLPPLMAVLGSSLDKSKTVISVVNPLDGTLQYYKELNSKLQQVQLTTEHDNEFTKILLILTEDKQVHTFPPGQHAQISHLPLYFTLVNEKTLTVQGMQVAGSKVVEIWSTQLRGDKVLAVVGKGLNDMTYSQGRVLGDRSVLHKYINPNLMGVIIETTDDSIKGALDFHLFDMVSGRQLHHARHKQCSGPAHMVITENWAVYNMYNQKNRRHETVVIEMFESVVSNTTEFSSLMPHYPPRILSQSYVTPDPLAALTVTQTLRSITNRAIIFAKANGRVGSVPKRMLDPRRPVVLLPRDKEEQLIPYHPMIEIPPPMYLNYNVTLEKIEGMITGASGLESTSLLFVYGMDLFFTRVTPANTFDLLNEDFDYWLIGIVLLGLLVATIITHALAEQKALNKKWK